MTTLSFKVSDGDALLIRQRAKREKLSVSEYLRRRAVGTENSVPVGRMRCDLTDAEIFAPLEGSPAMTNETVRQMLADFP